MHEDTDNMKPMLSAARIEFDSAVVDLRLVSHVKVRPRTFE